MTTIDAPNPRSTTPQAAELPDTPPVRLSDDELMQRIDEHSDEGSLAELRRRYGAFVARTARSIVGDPHLAEDVVQEVFSRVFWKAALYRGGSNFRAWLYGITSNQALTVLRSERRGTRVLAQREDDDVQLDLLQLRDEHHDDRRPEEREFMSAFAREVAALPTRYRVPFEQCVMQGRPYADVAAELDTPVGTVAIRIRRARQKLFGTLSCHLGRLRRPPSCTGVRG